MKPVTQYLAFDVHQASCTAVVRDQEGRIRILYVFVSILSAAFPGIIVYIILWILMPRAPE